MASDSDSAVKNGADALDIFLSRPAAVFLLVCRERSFSHVAKQLGITQPAVSQSIAALERDLGFALFDRTKHPMTVTREAMVLGKVLEGAAQELRAATDLCRSQNCIRSTVRIGVVESFGQLVGADLIERLLDAGLHVSMHTGNTGRLQGMLAEGRLDMIIASGRLPESSDYYQSFLYSEPYVALLPASVAPWRENWSWTQLNLSGLPMIRYTGDTANGMQSEGVLAHAGVRIPSLVEVDDHHLMFSLVGKGKGWALTHPLCVLQFPEARERLRIVQAPAGRSSRELWIIRKDTCEHRSAELVSRICRELVLGQVVASVHEVMPWTRGTLTVCGEDLMGRDVVS